MDTYECNRCSNVWQDYEPKSCPFCFSQEIRLVVTVEKEPEIWSMMGNDHHGDCVNARFIWMQN